MVHTNYPSNRLNQSTAEQGFGATVVSGTLDDVARQRGDGVPQVRPQGCFSRLPLRQRKQQPAFVKVNGQDAIVLSQPGGDFLFRKKIAVSEGSNTITVEATDASGNSASNAYSVAVGGVQKTLEYDLNGNLRYEKDPGGTVLREFQWDAINRLVKIIDGNHETAFEYDGFDRRVRVIETDNKVELSNNVYLWDGTYIAQRRSADGSTIERSYFSQGFEEGSDDYYTTKDHLGSIREVVASDGTTVEAVYDYSPWGEVMKIGGSGVESDFLYTGHLYHGESDLHLTLYRAYNSELGRWLSRDPLEFNLGIPAEFLPEGPNLYAYVGNNPINYYDLEGELALNAVGAGIGAGISFGTQFAANGGFGAIWNGDWGKAWQATKCVDYADVGISAGMGALGLSAGKNAYQGAKALHTANRARRGRHLTNYLKEEAVDQAVKEGKNAAAKGVGALAGQELKNHLDAVPGDDCE